MAKKIFIIEDDANLLYSLQAKFSIGEFQVETDTGSNTIEETLERIKKFNPDFAVLDLILPRVDGFALLSKMKSDQQIRPVPVFIFTNLSDEDSRERSKRLGTDYYFIKSDFTIDEFVDKVRKIIKNRDK